MKKVRFTIHAERKISERNIRKDLVTRTIENPDATVGGRENTKIAQKEISKKMLRVVFRENEYDYIVITAYFTEKERYGVKE